MPCRGSSARLGAIAQDEPAKADERRGGLAAIAFEVVYPGHRIVVEVEDAGIDQVDEGLAPEPALDDGIVEGGGDGVGLHIPPRLSLECIAPPLQADLARHRIGDCVAHARNGEAEGGEREEMRPVRHGGEQRREIAVGIALPDQCLAMLEREGERVGRSGAGLGLRHATAIRAVATLRFSAIRML